MNITFDLDAWHVWLILGMALVIAEVIGTEFILLALGAAALVTGLLTALFQLALNGQFIAAATVAVLFVPAFFRFYRRRFKATGTQAVIGEGLYRDTELIIEEYGGRSGIRIQGDFFPAKSTEGDPLRSGELVRVLEMHGLTAVVERI
ncbi:MAG: NfeD family protein [Pseudomonadales bacterium]|nr:NfeD family protein [Pseudomonadales bacterium]